MTAYPYRRYRYRKPGSTRNAVAGIGVAAVTIAALSHPHAATGALRHAKEGLTAPSQASPAAAKAIAFAEQQTGCAYVYGGTGPCSSGFDCSGLVMQAWAHAGVSIPRTSEEQWAALRHIGAASLAPGDLIFYTGSPIDPPPGHVTMYVGGGQMVEAYATGYPVRVTAVRLGATGYADPAGGGA